MTAPDPVAFSIAGLDIRWYGILISAGVVLAIIISYVRAPKHQIDPENVLDAAIWLLPFGIVGARAYYVLFSWEMYKNDLPEIFNIRAGGLAIHGGLIFGILGVFIMTRIKKVDFLALLDLFAPAVALAQSIGRWGNFFNSEAYGTPTNLPWAIVVSGQKVHPTFLYESIWCLLLFIFLLIVDRRGAFKGEIFSLYGMLYSFERFFVEALRTDSLYIGPFRQAQVISVCIFIFSLILFIVCRSRARKRDLDGAQVVAAEAAGDLEEDLEDLEKEVKDLSVSAAEDTLATAAVSDIQAALDTQGASSGKPDGAPQEIEKKASADEMPGEYADTTLENEYFSQAAETASEIDEAFGETAPEFETEIMEEIEEEDAEKGDSRDPAEASDEKKSDDDYNVDTDFYASDSIQMPSIGGRGRSSRLHRFSEEQEDDEDEE